jgi:atypical dual specificity phosphatase
MYEEQINKQQSEYTDSRIEGIYLKTFDGDYVKYRSKLVRNDFLSGNQHWSKNIIEKNKISFD